MEIPFARIEPQTLDSLIEEFVTREGTDYGNQEHSLHSKVAQVKRQLQMGTARIVYDPESRTCHIESINPYRTGRD
ncbi:MAG: YheU family protein [Pseudomonadales bacterium]|nr:YheU family protein [Pseudomonadales bacterium]